MVKRPTRIISFLNEKGGSGKTTLTLNIGAYLASRGEKVLIADLDPQGHIGKSLGVDTPKLSKTIFHLLMGIEKDPEKVILRSSLEGLHFIPSNKRLTDFALNVTKDRDRHLKLKHCLQKISSYDYILIDAPPSLGLATVNILMAVNEVVIPVSMTYLALDGCAEIVDSMAQIRRNFSHPQLNVSLVVPTFYRDNEMSNSILAKLNHFFKDRVAKSVLKYDYQIDQAQSFGKTIFEHAPHSFGAKMLEEIAREVINIGR